MPMTPTTTLKETSTAAAGTMVVPQPAMSPSASTTARPLTGEEYVESIRDGREIYIYGDRVEDVTTHPAFRNSVRMTARLYDALHDARTRDVLTCSTDTGNGGYTMRFFRAARSSEDLVGAKESFCHRGDLELIWSNLAAWGAWPLCCFAARE